MDSIGKHTLEVMRGAKWYNTWLFNEVKRQITGEILEVGAGIGNFSRLLRTKGSLTTIDIYEDYISSLKKGNKLKGVSIGFGNIEEGKYFFKNKLFDSIVCLNVIEHIRKDNKALRNMYQLLKSNGKIILLVPAHMFLFSPFDKKLGHFRRYNKKDLEKKLTEAGFKIINIKYLNWWAAIGWIVFLKFTGWNKMPNSQVGVFNALGRLLLWPEKYISPPFGLSILAVAKK